MQVNDPYSVRPPRARGGAWPMILVLALLAGVAAWKLWGPDGAGSRLQAAPRTPDPAGELQADERATIALFKDSSPSVVFITTLAVRQDAFSNDLTEIPRGTGSGFVWDDSGHIVTNYHVVEDSDRAKVMLGDHSVWDAELIGVAPHKDMAVLKISAGSDRLPPIKLGTSKDLQVGQNVLAIGNPFGLDQTLTTGVISGLGRKIKSVTQRTIQGVIQTDAAINPGNSGGPLLDGGGRLIGMNTAIYSPSGAYAGVGFAVPVDEINRIVPQLIQHGEIVQPGLGIYPADDPIARRLQLTGVLVRDVNPGGAAGAAGMRPTRMSDDGQIVLGDIIVAMDGEPIRENDDLFTFLDKHRVGDPVQVTVQRDGSKINLDVTLQALPQSP